MASLVEEDKISQINSKEAVSSGSDSHPRQAIEDLIVINDMKPGFENANDLYSRPKPLEDSSSLFTLSKYLEEI